MHQIYTRAFLKDPKSGMEKIREKYNFEEKDYLKASYLFERAYLSNNMQKLLKERENFDWSNVPEYS